jgi:uncharacterized membrane protein (DUF485 family)
LIGQYLIIFREERRRTQSLSWQISLQSQWHYVVLLMLYFYGISLEEKLAERKKAIKDFNLSAAFRETLYECGLGWVVTMQFICFASKHLECSNVKIQGNKIDSSNNDEKSKIKLT